MNTFLSRTFGGLSLSYYLRQLFFSVLLFLMLLSLYAQKDSNIPLKMVFIMGFNTLLYPYSRFVFESIASFFRGDTVTFGPAIIIFSIKISTIIMCWICALFIAPFGLIWLYFYHSKEEMKQQKAAIEADLQQKKEIRKNLLLEEEVRAEMQAQKALSEK